MQHNDAYGIPYAIAETAETRNRRLYIDGEPFPYATSADIDLQVIRTQGLTTVLVPVMVLGPVTVTPKTYGPVGRDAVEDKSIVTDDTGKPVAVWIDGRFYRLGESGDTVAVYDGPQAAAEGE